MRPILILIGVLVLQIVGSEISERQARERVRLAQHQTSVLLTNCQELIQVVGFWQRQYEECAREKAVKWVGN